MLKRQYFGHLMQRVDSFEKTLMLWGIGGRTRRGRQRMRWLWFMGSQRAGHAWGTELNWTEAGLVTDRAWAPLWAGNRFPQGQISFSRLNPMRCQGTKAIARILSDPEGKLLSKGAQAKAGDNRWAVIISPRTSRLWGMMVTLWYTPDHLPQV